MLQFRKLNQPWQAAGYYARRARRARVRAHPDAGPSQAVCDDTGSQHFTLAGVVPAGGGIKWVVVRVTGTAAAVIAEDDALDSDVAVSGTGTVTLRLISDLGHGYVVVDEMTLTVWDLPTAAAGDDQAGDEDTPFVSFTMAAVATHGTGVWSVVSATGTAVPTIVDSADPETEVQVAGNGVVTLRWTVTSDRGCTAAIDDVVLTVNEV